MDKIKEFGSRITTLITSNEEMGDTMKIVKSLEESVLLIGGVSQTIETKTKEKRGWFLGISLNKIAAMFFGNKLECNGAIATSQEKE